MRGTPGTRLAMGIVGLLLLTTIAALFEIGPDHRQHIIPFAFCMLILWAAYFYALRRKRQSLNSAPGKST
jgi:hypothetical protein